ncbi:MAG: single-stranded DNA-binding protein, partial [Phycisphaerae bacterium]|nr:single-stranded DNA-binding protein [Phycisphaerae bacterium]
PYILRDGVTYGTSLKLKGIQLISLQSAAGVDVGDMSTEDVAELFGSTAGFKVSDTNVVSAEPSSVEDDTDF